MKNVSKTVLAFIMAVLMATLIPAQAFADSPDYISEVKVAMGENAEKDLEGYTILKNGNSYVDLNQGAGSTSYGAKGNNKVLLGYKITEKRAEAITDLALMNMNGGYDVAEYERLMNTQLKKQILPFIENFMTAIEEYRANYNGNNKKNKQRAQYMCSMLNTLTDDDCGGAPLGDLLLNETKYEMGDEAYNKLSDEEKNKHCDIVTLLAQANGQATLMMENTVTRACDTSDNTWVDRFVDTTYEDMISATGKAPTDARKELAKKYDDDANMILDKLTDFQSILEKYDEALEALENYDADATQEAIEAYLELDEDADMTSEENIELLSNYMQAQKDMLDAFSNGETVAIREYLKSVKYEDGTLYDFFMRSEDDFSDDITSLYPLAASLSDGQKAGLEFVSLKELTAIVITDVDSYKNLGIEKIKENSVYEGVDRAIYQKGGVALTSDALRDDAMKRVAEEKSKELSGLTITMIVLASVMGFACLVSAIPAAILSKTARYWARSYSNSLNYSVLDTHSGWRLARYFNKPELNRALPLNQYQQLTQEAAKVSSRSATIANSIAIGLGIAAAIFTVFSIYSSLQDMKEYYKVDYIPVPHYMIDEKDLIGYNSKGEKIVLKNQTAYYNVVECNRASDAEYYKSVDTCSDLNGDVGQQWLALYSVKNEAENPILASSLKTVIGSNEIPAGYRTGIHLFGSDFAFNLNSYPYVWNKEAKSIMVYFKRDENPKATGSNFTGGTLALTGGAGVVFGAAVSALGMTQTKKKKESE